MSLEGRSNQRIFEIEAWGVLSGLEETLEVLDRDPAGASKLAALLCHRLEGSAGLYGRARLAHLAAALGRAVGTPAAAKSTIARAFFSRALGALRRELESLSEPEESTPSELETEFPRYFVEPSGVAADLRAFAARSPRVLEYFLPEARELVDQLGDALLDATSEPTSRVAKLFRAAHTLKGSAYTVGCTPIGDLAHGLEEILGAARKAGVALDDPQVAALATAEGSLRGALDLLAGHADADEVDRAFAAAHSLLPRAQDAQGAEASEQSVSAEATEKEAAPQSFRVDLDESELDVDDSQIPRAAEQGAAILARLEAVGELPAAVSAVSPTVRVALDRIDDMLRHIGEMSLTRARLERELGDLSGTSHSLGTAQSRLERLSADLEDRFLSPSTGADSRSASSSAVGFATARPLSASAARLESIFDEIELDRYDEQTILARRLGEIAADLGEVQAQQMALSAALRSAVEELGRTTREVRHGLGRVRLVPLEQLYARLRRAIRSLAAEVDRPVEVKTSGDSIEIDSAVAEALVDPLLHAIRNALVHGIESASERRQAGKPEVGTISLSCSADGRLVTLEVADDGRGLDLQALRRQAVEGGHLTAEVAESLSDEDAARLAFLPGVSTSAEVSALAGRGVGMDVVAENLRQIGGEATLVSTRGDGARLVLRFPSTLLVSEILVVTTGGQRVGLPVDAVERMTFAPRDMPQQGPLTIDLAMGIEAPQPISVLALDQVLGLAPKPQPGVRSIVVIRIATGRFALLVDELVGFEEVVVQELGEFLRGLELFSGAALSADGSVLLVLNPAAITHSQELSLPEDEPLPQRARRPELAASETVPRKRILLVDDSLSVRRVLSTVLTQAGYEVRTAADGGEAAEILAREYFDVLVTDLEMPRMHGYELIASVRGRQNSAALPIVVITTRVGPKHVSLARDMGADAVLGKPVAEADLLATLGELLARGEG